jgi:hypothetical protein
VLSLLGIIGGGPSNEAAVICISADTLPICSGTLLGDHTVLTAGHCAAIFGASVSYFANVGPDCHAPLHRARIAEFVADAGVDLALARLETGLDAGVLELHDGAPNELVVRHVGYGTDQESQMNGWGTRREVTHAISRIDAELIWSGDAAANTCNGDSGGPALDPTGRIIGVISDGPDCHSLSADQRVDIARGWIDQQLNAWDPPVHCGCSTGGPLLLVAIAGVGKNRLRRRA